MLNGALVKPGYPVLRNDWATDGLQQLIHSPLASVHSLLHLRRNPTIPLLTKGSHNVEIAIELIEPRLRIAQVRPRLLVLLISRFAPLEHEFLLRPDLFEPLKYMCVDSRGRHCRRSPTTVSPTPTLIAA